MSSDVASFAALRKHQSEELAKLAVRRNLLERSGNSSYVYELSLI
jgi:hypothetical protein